MRRRARWREALIVENVALVERAARQVFHRCTAHGNHYAVQLDEDDLRSAGFIGLIQAADRYRREDGPFINYASFRVRGAILDSIKRRQYADNVHDSIEAMAEANGQLPPAVERDRGAAPDELAIAAQHRRLVIVEISGLPGQHRDILTSHLAGEAPRATAERHYRSLTWTRGKLREARERVIANLRRAA